MKKIVAVLASPVLLVALGIPATANTSAPVYMEAVNPSVAKLTVLATSGNKYGNWLLPGIPDGMGAYLKGGKVEILVNHEIAPTGLAATLSRAGGDVLGGSTVTKLSVDPTTLAVTNGEELLKNVVWYDYATNKHSETPSAPPYATVTGTTYHDKYLNRFCSAGLAEAGVLAFKQGKKTFGYTGHVFLTGEESGDESRGFAINTTGEAVQLPRLGLASWEVFHAAKTNSLKTVIVGGEDGSDITSQFWMYVGTKTDKGAWYERAGLNNGKNYVLRMADVATDTDFRAKYPKGTAGSVSFIEIDWRLNGKNQNDFAKLGVGFSRIEDGAFDPKNPNDYYFVTTQSNKDAKATAPNPATPTVTRDGGALWKLSYKDIKNPLLGGTLTMLLDGSEAPYLSKPDNIEMDELGNILIQEDPGNNAALARVVAYNIATQRLVTVLSFKSSMFTKTGSSFMTEDEESSGITDVTKLFKKSSSDTSRYYILNAQIHATPALSRPDVADAATSLASIIEGGQVYLLEITNWNTIYN
jgi:hypothetical protein